MTIEDDIVFLERVPALRLLGRDALRPLARRAAGGPGATLNAPSRRAAVEAALRELAPKIPPHEFGAVIDHALDSEGLTTAAPEDAAWLSLTAYVRHVFTDYDDLLAQGYDRDSARHFVADEIAAVLGGWGGWRKLGGR